MKRARTVLAALCVALAFNSSPLPAQTSADTTAMARAVARFIATEVMPEARGAVVILLQPHNQFASETRFDTLMARELSALPVFQGPIRDRARAVHIRTRGIAPSPHGPENPRGLPTVTVITHASRPSRDWGSTGRRWLNQSYYTVRATAQGREVVGAPAFDTADGSCTPAARSRRRG